ncbi:MAG: hypothetical protein K8R02_07225 [Anaerohalosphaeraceae bacterium]|nr:hypothetical protein [Anaerohalosphaeraceae bacterium]
MIRQRTASFGKLLLLILVFVSLLSIVDLRAANDESYRLQALRQTGKQLLEIGYEQYRRGMYDSAFISLSKAEKYKDYLSIADSSKLSTLLSKVRASDVAARPVEIIQQAVPVVQPRQQYQEVPVVPATSQQYQEIPVVQPQQQYQEVPVVPATPQQYYQYQQTPVVQEPEVIYIDSPTGAAINQQYITGGQTTTAIVPTDQSYVEFVPVSTADIAMIDRTQYIEIPVDSQPQQIEVATFEVPTETYLVEEIEVVEPVSDTLGSVDFDIDDSLVQQSRDDAKESYIDVIQQKQRIQQGYTKAVVDDAIAKAKEYAAKEEFAKAKDELSRAGGIVEKNKLLLGESVYAEYIATLGQLKNEMAVKQQEIESQKAEITRLEAKTSQERLRAQQATDRQKRIEDLMAHSQEYQEQQRYEEALGQVETLLAIDPTNKQAARNKQMLEDILNLRRQLEVKREIGREEQDLFYDNQVSMIPHAELMTYPRNWQDITAKRSRKAMSGIAPADVAVYKQLETLVDLSALGPDTVLDEAIEIIRTAVDPPLKITVRWRDLEENGYIEPDTVIGTRGINGISLGKGLKELLDSVSGGIVKIDYAVEDGVITIATKESLPAQLVPRPYDITELIGTPASFSAEMDTVSDTLDSGGGSGSGSGVEIDSQERLATSGAIVQMIEDTIEPDSWFVNGGDGTISVHGNKLVILQTPQIHEKIYKLLMEDLRESLGQQVSIETRFLFVSENFLEEIGIDMDITIGKFGKLQGDLVLKQDSLGFTAPSSTLIPGSIGGSLANGALNMASVGYGSPLDDLQLTFLLKATQAHKDAKMLTAPRVTVLSGESAYITVQKETAYVSDYDFENVSTNTTGNAAQNRTIADPQTDTVVGGVVLNVTPTISSDKRYVILQISTNYTKAALSNFDVFSETGQAYKIGLPVRDVTRVQTRVSIPDGGTLLIGGQKLGAEVNMEAGVPGMSKLPIIGRLFSTRSKVKDQDILLVLVKPTIILQDESEREYFAPLE